MADINEQLNEIIGRLGGEPDTDNLYTSKLDKIISLLEGGSGSGGSYRVVIDDITNKADHTPTEIFDASYSGLIPYLELNGFTMGGFCCAIPETAAVFFGTNGLALLAIAIAEDKSYVAVPLFSLE